MLNMAQKQSVAGNHARLVAVFNVLRTSLDAFFKYVPRPIVEVLSPQGKLGILGMDSKPVTISFTDIRGFTTWCSRVNKNDMKRFITTYFEIMTIIVQAFRGVVDKYRCCGAPPL